jgi:hypothetical protein
LKKTLSFDDWRKPPPNIVPLIRAGDQVRLRSGSPEALVVETMGATATIAWRHPHQGVRELDLPVVCLRLA